MPHPAGDRHAMPWRWSYAAQLTSAPGSPPCCRGSRPRSSCEIYAERTTQWSSAPIRIAGQSHL